MPYLGTISQPLAATAPNAPHARRWTTLLSLQVYFGAIGSLVVLSVLAGLVAVLQAREAFRLVGPTSTLGIDAAQAIRAGLADMDAQLAAELVARPGQYIDATNRYIARRSDVVQQLTSAAQSIRPETAAAVYGLQDAFVAYDSWATRLREFHEHGDAAALSAARHASAVLHDQIRPQAEQLTQANTTVLDGAYRAQQTWSLAVHALILAVGLVLVAVLVATQWFLSARTHRTLNPPLLLATLLTVGMTAHVLQTLGEGDRLLQVARNDTYAPLAVLTQTRASAADARSDESRWLYDQVLADAAAQAFAADTGLVHADLAGPAAVRAWAAFLAVDERIRSLEQQHQHGAAVALDIGTNPNEGAWAFDQFIQVLDVAIADSRAGYEAALARGDSVLAGLEFQVIVAAVALAGLTGLGLWPRLREYLFS